MTDDLYTLYIYISIIVSLFYSIDFNVNAYNFRIYFYGKHTWFVQNVKINFFIPTQA